MAATLTGINIFGLINPHKEGLFIFCEYDNSTSVFIFIAFLHLFRISLCVLFIFFIEVPTISFNFLYPVTNIAIDNEAPNIHIKQNTFSILTLWFKGIRLALLITLLFEGCIVLIDIGSLKVAFVSSFEELVCVICVVLFVVLCI